MKHHVGLDVAMKATAICSVDDQLGSCAKVLACRCGHRPARLDYFTDPDFLFSGLSWGEAPPTSASRSSIRRKISPKRRSSSLMLM
jgi:hypothetical protein